MNNDLDAVTDEFISEFVDLLNRHGMDSKFGMSDVALAANVVTHLEQQYILVTQTNLHDPMVITESQPCESFSKGSCL